MKNNVSIIVPVYNAQKYLKECVESLIVQTLPGVEIIFINDGSTDSSFDILLQYRQSFPDRIKLYSMQANSKQGAARNFGIREAEGKYLLFVDSDDVLEPQACERLYQKAEEAQADIVFCDYTMFSDEYERYCQHVQNVYLGELTVEKRKALLTTSVVPWAKLLARDLLMDHNIFFPEQVFYEDQATTYLYYLYAEKAVKVEEALYKYRLHDNSASSAKNVSRHFQQTDMALELVRRVEQRGLLQTYHWEMEYFLIEQMYCLGIHSCFHKFDHPPVEYLNRLLTHLMSMCPEYQKNPYYDRYLSERDKQILQTHQKSVENLIDNYQSAEFEKYCSSYAGQLHKNDTKIKELVDFLREKKFRTVLWGAGKYCLHFIQSFQKYDFEFDYLVDRHSALWGKSCGRYVISPVEKIGAADIVIIEYTVYAHEIRRQILDMGLEIKTIDLEVVIKHDLMLPMDEYLE